MYCPCCKKYEETDADPIENINKFLEFIKKENEKINPPPKLPTPPKKKRHPGLEDDSLSEITDIEEEQILTKYYKDVGSKIEKKKAERMAARRRLWGESVKESEQQK